MPAHFFARTVIAPTATRLNDACAVAETHIRQA
jgi:hypothetical protein